MNFYDGKCIYTNIHSIIRNVDPEEIDQSGQTALHIACEVGRAHNVEVLLKHAFKGENKHSFNLVHVITKVQDSFLL